MDNHLKQERLWRTETRCDKIKETENLQTEDNPHAKQKRYQLSGFTEKKLSYGTRRTKKITF